MLRVRRAQNTSRKLAAEQAVIWCTLELEMMERNSVSDDDVTTTLFHLQVLQYELSTAVDDLSKSLHDIGFIRSLIRNKGSRSPKQPACHATVAGWQRRQFRRNGFSNHAFRVG